MNEDEPGLTGGELRLHGRVMSASNATFVADLGGRRVVYKPVSGERPLWDFPDGTLAGREVATYLVSEALGWDVVPGTALREGPLGPGMVQWWQEPDPAQDPVDVVSAGRVPDDVLAVFEGVDALDRPVVLVHEDTAPLRRMALFDVVVNNADRKGGHVLPMAGGHRYGVDHGLTLHVEPKLRTVLWGWAGQPVPDHDLADLAALLTRLEGDLGERLRELVTAPEVRSLAARCERIVAEARMPTPGDRWPTIPWPPF